MPERSLTNLNPGLVSTVPGRAGQPLNFDPTWIDVDRLQRLTINERQLRMVVRQEIERALEGLTAATASGEAVLDFDVVNE